MYEAVERRLGQMAAFFVDAAARRPLAVLVAALLLTALSVQLAATRLVVDSDPDRMTSAELPYRKTKAQIEANFPQLVDNLSVLVAADSADDARAAAEQLALRLAADREHVASVFLPGSEPFFEERGIWYVDDDTLTWLADDLERASPLLLALERDPSLATLAGTLASGLEGDDAWADSLDAGALWLEALARSLESGLAGDARPVPWHDLLVPAPPIEEANPQVLFVRPTPAFLGFGPAEQAIAAVRAVAATLDPRDGLRVQVTGDVAVGAEEMSMIRWEVVAASAASFLLVTLVLFVTLRSFRLIMATLATLVMGLAWTAGFAAVAVGHLNALTMAFGVLYIGLGVDFGIHFALGFSEQRGRGAEPAAALRTSGSIVGSSLVICAGTTAIGFFAFIPTSYTGVAELGIISGTGIFLSLLATLTVYPALIDLGLGKSGKLATVDPRSLSISLPTFPLRYPRVVLGAVAVAAVASMAALPKLRFDDDPLNVRDPRVESVRAMNEMLESSEISPWTVEFLIDAAELPAVRTRLDALPEVGSVVSLDSFVPGDVDEKARALRRAAHALDPVSALPVTRSATLDSALARVRAAAQSAGGDSDFTPGVDALAFALGHLADADDVRHTTDLEADLFGELVPALEDLRAKVSAPPITLDTLPDSLVARYRARDGRLRVEVFAEGMLREPGAQARFADAVRSVRAEAGGPAVATVEFARAITSALREAFALALAVIVLLLLFLWRSIRWTALALAPLLLGALFTAALAVWIGLPLNFANVIVLPLMLGIGVDSGIHLVHRWRLGLSGDVNILHTSTARAVFFSALTSLASFATLGFASHRGIASLSHLLTLGLTVMLACNLVVLPALLAWGDVPRRGRRAGR